MRTGLQLAETSRLSSANPVGAYRNAAIGSEAAQRNSGAVKDLNRELTPLSVGIDE